MFNYEKFELQCVYLSLTNETIAALPAATRINHSTRGCEAIIRENELDKVCIAARFRPLGRR